MTFLTKNVVIIIVFVAVSGTAYGRSKPHQVHLENKYDQKQLGDYNVHLHLNDLKVIAIVGSRGSGGEYDYNYDYADFTVKPIDVDITEKPQSSNHSTPEKTTLGPSSSSANSNSVTESKPILTTTKQIIPVVTNGPPTTQKEEITKVTKQILIDKLRKVATESATEKKASKSAITNISILPAESNERSSKPVPRGHSARYKKCGQGYSRDKQGRCRKIRRNSSYMPLNISRLASNLVQKLKYHISRKS